MRLLVILVLSGTLGILGCETESTNGGTDGGTGGSGGTAGSGGMAGTGGSTGTGGTAGSGGGASSPAQTFCDRYETICTFGGTDRYENEAACLDAYNNTGQSDCYETHLDLAETQGAATHCPHATGIGQCES